MGAMKEYRKRVNKLVAQRRLAIERARTEREALDKAKDEVKAVEEARQIVQTIAQTIQQKAHTQIARVVSRCLNVVFEDAYDFQIRFERKRGKTEAKLEFYRDGMTMDDPLNEVGGGVIDVAALALRLAAIRLSRSSYRPLLVLDEPWKNIRGEGNKARTRRMILKLAKEMGIQFVINTEIKEYQLGEVVELS